MKGIIILSLAACACTLPLPLKWHYFNQEEQLRMQVNIPAMEAKHMDNADEISLKVESPLSKIHADAVVQISTQKDANPQHGPFLSTHNISLSRNASASLEVPKVLSAIRGVDAPAKGAAPPLPAYHQLDEEKEGIFRLAFSRFAMRGAEQPAEEKISSPDPTVKNATYMFPLNQLNQYAARRTDVVTTSAQSAFGELNDEEEESLRTAFSRFAMRGTNVTSAIYKYPSDITPVSFYSGNNASVKETASLKVATNTSTPSAFVKKENKKEGSIVEAFSHLAMHRARHHGEVVGGKMRSNATLQLPSNLTPFDHYTSRNASAEVQSSIHGFEHEGDMVKQSATKNVRGHGASLPLGHNFTRTHGNFHGVRAK
ncbi:hypothetical protein BC830DRAFT_1163264 [Chytriomyces sp. MP71]|nr:hypothetical protein BC830DRAFT_1163264 [Chytriomyces sp. MP71]